MEKRHIHLEGAVQASVTLRIDVRTYLSVSHLRAASYLAREAGRIERDYDPAEWSKVHEAHRAYVVGAVLASVAFLEATINEVLSDAREGNLYEHLKGATLEQVQALANLANSSSRKGRLKGTLQKYETALKVAGQPAAPLNEVARTDAYALVQLRNALVHYQPETIFASDTGGHTEEAHRLEKLLGDRFAPNPFAGRGNPFWPQRCLSHGCAMWSLTVATTFVQEFAKASRLNVLSATPGGAENSA